MSASVRPGVWAALTVLLGGATFVSALFGGAAGTEIPHAWVLAAPYVGVALIVAWHARRLQNSSHPRPTLPGADSNTVALDGRLRTSALQVGSAFAAVSAGGLVYVARQLDWREGKVVVALLFLAAVTSLLTFVIYSLLRILCERPVRPKNPSAHGSASMQIAAPPRLWVSATVIIASTTLGLVGTTSLLGSERLLIIAGWGGFVGLGAIVVMRIFARALERDLDHLATSLNQEMFRAPTDPLPSRRRDRNLQFRETTELQQAFTRSSTQVARTNVKRFVEIERAKEAERLKSQFLANMSHDLRAPLNSILGFSDLLLRGIDGELSAGHVEMLELIQTNGETLLREIDEILDYAKIEAARLSLHREPTAVGMLLEGALHRTRERLKRSIRCACEIDPDLPPVFIDPLRTAQALEHLLSFAAVELPEDRSLAIRVLPYKTPTDPLIVEIRTPNKPAAMADIGRLRHGFFRIRGHAGLGLGLPIAAAIIDMQGGRLDIAERGEAMTFTVTLHGPNHQLTPRPDLAEKIGWGATSPHA